MVALHSARPSCSLRGMAKDTSSGPATALEQALKLEAAADPFRASKLPLGVAMHEAGLTPHGAERAVMREPDPRAPPRGWAGSFARCGGCGDFIGNTSSCSKCAPVAMPSNISMSSQPVVSR